MAWLPGILVLNMLIPILVQAALNLTKTKIGSGKFPASIQA